LLNNLLHHQDHHKS